MSFLGAFARGSSRDFQIDVIGLISAESVRRLSRHRAFAPGLAANGNFDEMQPICSRSGASPDRPTGRATTVPVR